jgi:hypothetical protein
VTDCGVVASCVGSVPLGTTYYTVRCAAAFSGIWIDPAEIAALPTSGAAWQAITAVANGPLGAANIADQNSDHDVRTLGLALYSARTGQRRAEAVAAVLSAIGTEYNIQPGDGNLGDWLCVGRNLAAYVIAADVLGLRADGDPNSAGTRVNEWIESWLTKEIPDNISGTPRPFDPFRSGSNASAQDGFAYAAIAAYLNDPAALQRAWDTFRRFAGDPTAPDPRGINLEAGIAAGWSHDPENAVAINPKGTTKNGVRIDGAVINDMRRGGNFKHPPGYTQYPWTGLDGLIPAAMILHRAGYPAFEVAIARCSARWSICGG